MNDQQNERRSDPMSDAMHRAFDGERIAPEAQVKLEETYARLHTIPQIKVAAVGPQTPERPSVASAPTHKPSRKRLAVAVAVAAVLVLFSCTAYAVSSLLQVGPNDAAFFTGKNLPVFDSLEPGTASMSADVGESHAFGNATVTLDTVSCDRNIVNLFFTIEQEGGFDLKEMSLYEGSNEGEWVRLQSLSPKFRYTMTSDGNAIDEGEVRLLDAYIEDAKVKCMLRITPTITLPDKVDISLIDGCSPALCRNESNEIAKVDPYSFGLDLSNVAQPNELGSRDIVFETSEGPKMLSIGRFTSSELGTVLVAKDYSGWSDDHLSYGQPVTAIDPRSVMIADADGTILNFVDPDNGGTPSRNGMSVLELATERPVSGDVTFTPMLNNEYVPGANEQQTFDASQIGTQIPVTEYGGFELVERTVKDSTATLTLRPYGWNPYSSYFDTRPVEEPGILWTESIDPETGEVHRGGHSGIMYVKSDYKTGDIMHMTSYYATSDEDLESMLTYTYLPQFGAYREEADAAQTFTLS